MWSEQGYFTTKQDPQLPLASDGICEQVGTGTRSEKIKTYNYKDSRVSDHRSKNNYTLDTVLNGGLEDSIQSMVALDQQERLLELVGQPA